MEWHRLLSPVRIRRLLGEESITRVDSGDRSEIQRDLGRAVFSTPVRRLQHKAQVFPLEQIDAVRTRLTHSNEVSNVARDLCRLAAQRIIQEQPGALDKESEDAYDIETIGAICGLVHDFGNPPFGHSGEAAIRSWFEKKARSRWEDPTDEKIFHKDFLNYEGNAHTLRLVSRLQVMGDLRGLNTTAAVFSALSKYTASSTEIDKKRQSKKKLGYFNSEAEIVRLVRAETGTDGNRHPLTFLIEAADDICYLLIDIEDAIKKGVIKWNDVKQCLDGISEATSLIEEVDRFIDRCGDLHLGKARDEAAAQYFRVKTMGVAVPATIDIFMNNYDSVMAGTYELEMIYESSMGPVFRALKNFSKVNVYSSKETVRLELLGHRVISDLLDLFMEADPTKDPSTRERKLYDLISHNYRAVYRKVEKWEIDFPDGYRETMLITDYICGMTDNFALRLHRQLTQGE